MQVQNGIAVVSANDPEYGRMKALATLGKAVFIGERYDEHGILTAAFQHPQSYRDNPEITIGGDFFMSALRDYREWQEKWWREAIQNAVDAKATRIECGALNNSDGTWTVWVEDNGVGMDRETILSKFLVLGATGKKTGESVGGFGKAKELLILPWIGWEVHSRNNIVVGQGTKYEVDTAKGREGTKITVTMSNDMHTTAIVAMNYIKKCYLPNITFSIVMVNQETKAQERTTVSANLKVGRLLAELTDPTSTPPTTVGAIYYDDKTKALVDQRLLVRAKGLYMFDKWMPAEVTGTVVVELTTKTVDLLTANRDDFRNYRLGRQVEEFTGKVAADVVSALKVKQNLIRKKYKGSGRNVGRRQSEFQAMLEKKLLGLPEVTQSAETGTPVAISPQNLAHITQMVRSSGIVYPEAAPETEEESPKGFFQNFTVPPEAIEAMTSIKMTGPNQIEAAAKQLAWQPDYFVMNNIPGYVPPRSFFPEYMQARHMKLVRLWCELCRFILIQLGCGTPFGIGVSFDPDHSGLHVNDEDGHWLFFNPFVPQKGQIDPTKSRFFDYAVKEDVYALYAVAIHECTHMADDVSYHNEAFSRALTYNFARTSGRDKQIAQIVRSLKARLPEFGAE